MLFFAIHEKLVLERREENNSDLVTQTADLDPDLITCAQNNLAFNQKIS